MHPMMNTQTNLRIIVIDDNPAIHLDFKKILLVDKIDDKLDALNKVLFDSEQNEHSFGLPSFQIDTASQGLEGVERVQQALADKNPYALAFVDIRMPPGLDGIETIKRIWEFDKDIQVVICTAYSDYTWEETIDNLGVSDNLLILKKPFDSTAVRQLACALTKKWQLTQDAKAYTDFLEKTVQERTASLLQQATHDPLTSLPNRLMLMDRLQQAIAIAHHHNSMFAVMFIDLDRFKLVNDSFSHEAGDKLLITLSERLRAITRAEDTIARLSGDEFIFVSLSQSLQKPENIITIASKILKEIMEAINIVNRDISITASIGISIYPKDSTNAEELLRDADMAMYHAKSLGGNQFQFYSTELQNNCLARLEMESDLRRALTNNEFYLDYQPQYDMKNNKLVGVEALIRWQHPKKGLLFPIDFIPIAEDTGLIVPIGDWVLKTACTQNKTWQDKGYPPFMIAVNMATKQFTQPDLVSKIKTILRETGSKAEYLEIEITENVILNNSYVIDTLNEIKKMGIHITLDDFGTGNSGLNYLRHVPIDRLKIDKTFIKNIDSNSSDEVIVQAIIAMANSLNVDVIAEGVENAAQVNFLKTKHCDKFQGYYFSKPISANEMEKLMHRWPDSGGKHHEWKA